MVDYEKVIQRVENMLYSISGCNPKEAKIVLEKCLKRNKLRVGKIWRIKKEDPAKDIRWKRTKSILTKEVEKYYMFQHRNLFKYYYILLIVERH